MITFKELSEAHKVGDKVTIVKGPKDVKGKEGRIGEIRKQAYKGAPKTYTVDYDHHETTGERKSVQLQAKHIKGMKEEVENLQEKHRVAITLSDPKHPAVTKRKELIQKTVRVQADNPGHAVDSAIHHFRKAGYKVHDHNYIGTVKENMDESALEKFRKAAAEREKEANKREAEMKARHATGKEDMKGSIDRLASRFKTDLEEGTFKYHMDKAVAAHDRGDVNRKKFHLSNAKQARYALKSTEMTKHKDLLDKYKSMTEGTNLEEGRGLADKYYKMAQDRKETAHENKGNHEVYHTHMADHHDAMSRYHEELGQHSLSQAHADKADIHHEKSMQKNEEAPVNNVGGGNIAGTQGDAGKKVVMTKKPMKRNVVQFKEFADVEVQFDMIEDFVEELASLNGVDSEKIWEDLETVDDEELFEYAIDAKGHKSSTGGLTQKGVDAYNAKTGGNLKTAVTTKPSKLKPGSKAANRRKSFCARMGGMKKRLTSAKTANDPDSRINKALRKWNC